MSSDNEYQQPASTYDKFLWKRFLNTEQSSEFYKRLTEEVPWKRMEWSRGRYLPRLVFRYGDLDENGRFVRVPVVEELTKIIEKMFDVRIHGAWGNLYRDGKDYTPFHQDSYNAGVYTISFGATRDFVVEKFTDKSSKEIYSLNHGDLFYFSPEFNSKHRHSVPKRLRVKESRISVVFFGEPLR